MIPRRCLGIVARMNRDKILRSRIRLYFGLGRGALYYRLRDRGLGHADLVLCLLRLNSATSISFAEELVGRPITHCPSFRLAWPTNGAARARVDASPRLVFVVPENPRLGNTRARERFEHFRVGRTVSQLLLRGVTRRDIRRATRKGWVKFQEVAHVSH